MALPVLEDKLFLLESWMEEDPYDDSLRLKRDEYFGLSEEVDILGKKMLKTIKLLQEPNQPSVAKLEKKRDQYEREFQEIVQYVQTDPFFAEVEESLPAALRANSLLGQPLDIVMEMPGLEESMVDFNYVPEEDDEDEASLQYTKKEVAVLKKKLKRVEKFIKEATTPQEIENLENKLDEYMMALEEEESKLRTLQAVVEESSNASYNDINSPGSLSEEATRRREELTQQQEEEE
jgi:hypothetical protein